MTSFFHIFTYILHSFWFNILLRKNCLKKVLYLFINYFYYHLKFYAWYLHMIDKWKNIKILSFNRCVCMYVRNFSVTNVPCNSQLVVLFSFIRDCEFTNTEKFSWPNLSNPCAFLRTNSNIETGRMYFSGQKLCLFMWGRTDLKFYF